MLSFLKAGSAPYLRLRMPSGCGPLVSVWGYIVFDVQVGTNMFVDQFSGSFLVEEVPIAKYRIAQRLLRCFVDGVERERSCRRKVGEIEKGELDEA